MTYKLCLNEDGQPISVSTQIGDVQWSIPFNSDLPEYQAYLAWLAEGNTPEPAPEPEPAPVLTTEQKLEAAGLTVAELKELFGLS